MIEVNEQVDVPSTPRVVWDLLADPHAIVHCVPGAELGEQQEDGSFEAGITIKFGPAKVTFRAHVALELDHATMTGNVTSRGKDKQGGTRFRTTMNFSVVSRDQGQASSVEITAQVEISGRLASLVESGAGLVVKRMTSDFSERLAARCAEASAALGG